MKNFVSYTFKALALCSLVFLIIPISVNAQFSRLPNKGYDGSAARSKVLSDGRVYAATTEGVIRVSNDNGFSFTDLGIAPGLSDYALINNELYAWSFSSLFKFNGDSFDQVLTFASGSFVRTVIGFDDKLFLLFYDYALVSTDNGTTFTELTEFKGQDFIGGSGIINNELYIATNAVGQSIRTIQKYTPEGWEVYTTEKDIQRLVAFDNVLYASLDFKLHQSTDGQNWTEVSTGGAVVTNRDFFLYTIGDGVLFGSKRTFAVKMKGSDSFVDVDFNSSLNPARSFNGTGFAKNGKIYLGIGTNYLISYDVATQVWAIEQEKAVLGTTILSVNNNLYTTENKSIYKRSVLDSSWTSVFADQDNFAQDFLDIVATNDGTIYASQVRSPRLVYSNDAGSSWTLIANTPINNAKLLARNDSLFAGNSQGLWLSTDKATTWIKVSNLNSQFINFVGSNGIIINYNIYSLADFSELITLSNNNGFITDYVDLTEYSFKGTNRALYRKKKSDNDNNWQLVTSTGNVVFPQIPVIDLLVYENSLLVFTSRGIYSTTDEGETWSSTSNIQIQDFSVTSNPNVVIVSAEDGYYRVDLTQFSSDPTIITLAESNLVRRDTVVVQELSAEVTPRGQEVRVWFEYGLTDNSGYTFDKKTAELTLAANDSSVTFAIETDTLAYYTAYGYRAVVAYGDGKIRYGDIFTFRSGIAQFWFRIDEEQQFDDFNKVLITRRGSILGWNYGNRFTRSIDNGESWEELSSPHSIQSIIQAAGDTLFAGSTKGDFMYSVNEGSSWTIPANDSLPPNFSTTRIMEITYDSLNHRYYAIYGDKNAEQNNTSYLVTSNNAGQWWQTIAINSIPEGQRMRNIHADSSGVLWVSTTATITNQPYLFKSTDFGKTYEAVLRASSNDTREGNEILSISKDTLFFSSSQGAWYSSNAGLSWDTAGVNTANKTNQLTLYPQIDFSRKHGIVNVTNTVEGSFESGFVSFSGPNIGTLTQKGASIQFGNNKRPNVRDADVSNNDMILIATDNGIWRYIAGSQSLPQNPTEEEIFVTIQELVKDIPTTISLSQNYPNPFNPSTSIKFELPEATNINLSVYNIMGQQVTVLSQGVYSAGSYQVQFNANNLSTGIYFYRLHAGEQVVTKKMMLLK